MNSQIKIPTGCTYSYEVLLEGKTNYWCKVHMEYIIWNTTYRDDCTYTLFQL